MHLIFRSLGFLAATSAFVSGHQPNQHHADGISPYGSAHAPDVISIDETWADFHERYHEHASNHNSFRDHPVSDVGRRNAKNFYLRVMPLGASITEGVGSDGSGHNGYRKLLRSQLRSKGWKVNMVGSKKNGDMADNDNQGHPGAVISEVHDHFTNSSWMKPNLVLINVGTNDCSQKIDLDNAGARFKAMVDDIFDSVPGVTVVVSTLLKSRGDDECAARVSQQYRDVVASYSDARIGLADIYTAMTLEHLGPDGIHPNDEGFKIFASVWWDAISKLEDGIQAPDTSAVDDDADNSPQTCTKVAGTARGPVKTQQGSGYDDGTYKHNRKERGAIESLRIEKKDDPKSITDAIPEHVFFANIVVLDRNFSRDEALDEWIRVSQDKNGKNTYYYRENKGDGKFGSTTEFDVGANCDSDSHYAFADFNNDGLDDFFCLKSGSAVEVSLNRGGNPPKFESLGEVISKHDGYEAADVRIADIDGDGRADYCLIKSDGTVGCSRNGGQGDEYTWQGFSTSDGLRGVVFDKNKGNKAGVVFGDINGDFRSDYLYVGDKGEVDTWTNSRGSGSGIVPDWKSAGRTHGGLGEAGIRDQIKFGRIYGSGRLDYIYLKEESSYYDVHVYENTGSGGTKLKADGTFYCDMRGTGMDDYVWIYNDGHEAEIFTNYRNPPAWGHDTSISLSVPGPRVGIHLADWNGDGRCDVLVQDKETGALTLHENEYDAEANKLTFKDVGVVTGSATCTEGWGVSIFDRGMALADIDGDGRADVLCLEPNGRVTAWLNTADGMNDVGQIKESEGWDRANMRFADVENSGRADLIHLDKYTGAGTVYKNNGPNSGNGSSFKWTERGVLFSAIDRGENMHFANLGGAGRADLINVKPNNEAFAYYNECGGNGGDDGPLGESEGAEDGPTGESGGADGDDSQPSNATNRGPQIFLLIQFIVACIYLLTV